MKKFLLVLAALLIMQLGIILPSAHAEEIPAGGDNTKVYTGAWQLHDTDGSIFHATLAEDGSAVSDWGEGEMGSWKIENGKAVVSWTDGWHDVLSNDGKGFLQEGYEPGRALTEKPKNSSAAYWMTPLLGAWKAEDDQKRLLTMTYRLDGTYSVDFANDGVLDVIGKYEMSEKGRLLFTNISGDLGPDCEKASGTYEYALLPNEIRYTFVEDACNGRRQNLALIWKKS